MEIQNDRKNMGSANNRELIGKLVHVMLAIDIYRGKQMFQERFLFETEQYFTQQSIQKLKENDVRNYCNQ